MSNYLIQGETLTNIANAIRTKTGKTDSIATENMATEISGISEGIIEVTELPTENINTNAVYSMGGKLYRYEETTVSTTVAPADLAGYTVTVPSGWTATAGYGQFYVYGQFYYNDAIVDFESIGVGKTFDIDAFEIINAVNNITFYQTDFPLQTFTPSESFSFTITDGEGLDTSLIQWLTNNNATFSKSEYEWVEYSSGGGESVADTVDKEVTISYETRPSSSNYATVYTNFGEFYIQAGTSQTIRVVGILGIQFYGAHMYINSDDGAIAHFYVYDGIRYFAIKNTTNSISILADNTGGGDN